MYPAGRPAGVPWGVSHSPQPRNPVAKMTSPRPRLERREQRCVPAAFTAGNLVVYRVGDGSTNLGSGAHPAFLDEYKTDGTLVQSISMPTQSSGNNQPFFSTGTSTSEAGLSLSAD